jgi:heterodisulfide reductase subunit B
MAIGIYPGCSLQGTAREYNESVYAVCEAFGIELRQIPDWNCCGATAAHNLDKELSLALPARILASAEKEGIKEIVVPCAACYSRLSVTQHELNSDPLRKNRISEIIEMPIKGTVRILNVLELINEFIMDKIDGKVTQPFNYKVAGYYGCLLVRPHGILKYDRAENPQSMDVILQKLGAKPVEWPFKTTCCGAGLSVSNTPVVAKLSGEIIDDAVSRGAEYIAVACPMCHSNLDMRRKDIEAYMKRSFPVPVLYITQVLGLAIGLDIKKLGIQRHFVPFAYPEKEIAKVV